VDFDAHSGCQPIKNQIVMDLPKECVNVMITYKTTEIVPDKYYGHTEIFTVTRRAFYSKSDGYYNSKDQWIETPNGYFSVPREWQDFTFSNGTSALLPLTFQSYGRVLPENIIKWELDNKTK
jgi:hypothetical protein